MIQSRSWRILGTVSGFLIFWVNLATANAETSIQDDLARDVVASDDVVAEIIAATQGMAVPSMPMSGSIFMFKGKVEQNTEASNTLGSVPALPIHSVYRFYSVGTSYRLDQLRGQLASMKDEEIPYSHDLVGYSEVLTPTYAIEYIRKVGDINTAASLQIFSDPGYSAAARDLKRVLLPSLAAAYEFGGLNVSDFLQLPGCCVASLPNGSVTLRAKMDQDGPNPHEFEVELSPHQGYSIQKVIHRLNQGGTNIIRRRDIRLMQLPSGKWFGNELTDSIQYLSKTREPSDTVPGSKMIITRFVALDFSGIEEEQFTEVSYKKFGNSINLIGRDGAGVVNSASHMPSDVNPLLISDELGSLVNDKPASGWRSWAVYINGALVVVVVLFFLRRWARS